MAMCKGAALDLVLGDQSALMACVLDQLAARQRCSRGAAASQAIVLGFGVMLHAVMHL